LAPLPVRAAAVVAVAVEGPRAVTAGCGRSAAVAAAVARPARPAAGGVAVALDAVAPGAAEPGVAAVAAPAPAAAWPAAAWPATAGAAVERRKAARVIVAARVVMALPQPGPAARLAPERRAEAVRLSVAAW
jgi:hypothetical protein